MNRNKWLLVFVAAAFASGCATPEPPAQTAEPKEERTTVTGSHIPSKSSDRSVTTGTSQGVQDSVMRGGGATSQPGGGR